MQAEATVVMTLWAVVMTLWAVALSVEWLTWRFRLRGVQGSILSASLLRIFARP